MTYNVFGGMLNLTQPITRLFKYSACWHALTVPAQVSLSECVLYLLLSGSKDEERT